MTQIEDWERRQEQAREHIRATIMNEFCEVMRTSGLPPMVMMRLAAQSVGAVYREMAAAHSGADPCPCGWRPNETHDIELMSSALRTACKRTPGFDLVAMEVVGRA